ncbi:hypothetical protein QBC38DRAFT_102408 [Podospora fimiseda]|uniref:EH domain-containing protein n=1 Tax=Podospora fimiseda TaxID=252190 RepID=A0AAN6YNM6_9PEZI|nr:hypothetical protein QBC38DRAFT_102408 [Podospora fimiseda]
MNKSASPNRNGDISSSSNNPNAAALSAALKGATLAFNKQKAANATDNKATPSKPARSPHRNSVSSAGGALLAATQAARDYSASQPRPRSPELVNRHETGGSTSVQDNEDNASFLSPQFAVRPSSDNGKQSSASFIAATLAASRSTSPIPPTNASASRGSAGGARRQSVGAASILSASSSLGLGPADVPDTESIKPTTSLVSLFESKMGEDVDPVKREPAVRAKSRVVVQAQDQEPEQQKQAKPKPKPKPKPQLPPEDGMAIHAGSAQVDSNHSALRGKVSSVKEAGSEMTTQSKAQEGPPAWPKSRNQVQKEETKVSTPPPERASQPEPKSIRPSTPPLLVSSSSITKVVSPRPIKLIEAPKLEPPIVPPPRRSTAKEPKTSNMEAAEKDPTQDRGRRESHSSVSSNDTFVSASSNYSPRAVTPTITTSRASKPEPPAPRGSQPRRKSLEALSAPEPPAPRRPSAPRISTPNLALDSLTNAIVASNLAASRLTHASSLPNPPLPPPARRHGNQSRPRSPLQPQRTAESLGTHHTGNGGSRSPNRRNQRAGMLQTLRAPPTSLSDDEDVRRRMDRHNRRGKLRHLPGKHHAHHEGSRRRWRDEVSARERRRYEAVWASNRGLFLQQGWSYTRGDDHQQQIEASKARDGPQADWVANVVVKDIWGRSRLPEDELSEVWQLVDQGEKGALARDEFVVGMWLIDQRLRGRKIPARVSASVWASVRGGGAGAVVVPDPRAARRDKGGKGRK